jgi:hypothetical protein
MICARSIMYFQSKLIDNIPDSKINETWLVYDQDDYFKCERDEFLITYYIVATMSYAILVDSMLHDELVVVCEDACINKI